MKKDNLFDVTKPEDDIESIIIFQFILYTT